MANEIFNDISLMPESGLQKFWNPNRSAWPMTSYEHEFNNPK